MLTMRKSKDRGFANLEWLESFHTFSFADYYDPQHMGFRTLRVINQDVVQPQKGFGTHPHKDMEIITYILRGTIEHRDSLGTSMQLVAGDVQIMTAGTGIQHSEMNPSDAEPVELLQIWIRPADLGLVPSYEQKNFPASGKSGRFCLLVSPDGVEGSLKIHQDVRLWSSLLSPAQELIYKLKPKRHGWVQLVSGDLSVNEAPLAAGDGLAISDEEVLNFHSENGAEFLLFDLA